MDEQGKQNTPADSREIFSEETITTLLELAEAIRPIYKRLLSEGYVIQNGWGHKPKN